MFRTSLLALYIFWFMDILNMDFMEPFDTTYPLNTLFWIGAIILSLIVYESPEFVQVNKKED